MTDKETKSWEKTRDAANKADMSSSKALQDDALTSVDGKDDVSLDALNEKANAKPKDKV